MDIKRALIHKWESRLRAGTKAGFSLGDHVPRGYCRTKGGSLLMRTLRQWQSMLSAMMEAKLNPAKGRHLRVARPHRYGSNSRGRLLIVIWRRRENRGVTLPCTVRFQGIGDAKDAYGHIYDYVGFFPRCGLTALINARLCLALPCHGPPQRRPGKGGVRQFLDSGKARLRCS
jgi:hypothetical protein